MAVKTLLYSFLWPPQLFERTHKQAVVMELLLLDIRPLLPLLLLLNAEITLLLLFLFRRVQLTVVINILSRNEFNALH